MRKSSGSLLVEALVRHRFAVAAVGLFGVAFGIYVSTLAPSITWANFSADSGEMASAVYTLGVAHPPGYPTYLLLGKLFSFLPLGEVAYRTNLMSAFFGAATVGLVFFIVIDFISLAMSQTSARSRLLAFASAVLASLSLAFAPILWSQATVTEVYTLNVFFAAVIILLLTHRAVKNDSPPNRALGDKYLLAAAFLLGLGLGSNFTLIFLLPGAILLIAARWRRSSLVTAPPALGALVLGLLIYVYLPVSAAQDPPVNWGQADDPSGFWWTVTATPYRRFVFGASSDLWLDRLKDWWGLLVDQYYYPGVALGLVGAWQLWRRSLLGGLSTLTYVVLLILYAGTYDTPDSFVYLIPGFMIFALWIGLGTYWTLTAAMPWLWQRLKMCNSLKLRSTSLILALLLILGLVPVKTAAANYAGQDLSNNREAQEYGRQVLHGIEPGSILLADQDDHIFALWYTQYVISPRGDIYLITQNLLADDWYLDDVEKRYPEVLPPEPGQNFQERLEGLILYNLSRRPVYLSDQTPSNLFLFEKMDIEQVTAGLEGSYQIHRVRGLQQPPS